MNFSFLHKSSSINKAVVILVIASLSSRLLGLIRDRIFAGLFGAGDVLDTYFAAFRIPDLIYNLLILGALSSAFIPVFAGFIAQGKKGDALKVANSMINAVLLFVGILCVILFIFMPKLVVLITPGFDLEKRTITCMLTRIMLLSPIFFGLSNVASGILNSFRRFLLYGLAPIMYNLGIIFGALVLFPIFGIKGLALGVVIGACSHMLIQLPGILRLGYRWKAILDFTHKGVREIGRLMVPRALGLATYQVSLLVNTIIGSTLAIGSVAVYNFANNLQSFPLGLFGISYAVASFPVLAEKASLEKMKGFVDTFSKSFREILFFVIPASVLFLLLRAQLVRIILGTGQFGWRDTKLTAAALGFFSISLFAQSLLPLLARSFYALHDTKTPVLVSVSCMGLNIIGSLLLSRSMGVVGLAFAFSIASFINMILLLGILRMKVGNLNDASIISSITKIILSALLAGLACYGTLYAIAPQVNMQTFFGVFIQGSGAGIIGIATYIIAAFALRCKEVQIISKFLTKFLRIRNFANGNKKP